MTEPVPIKRHAKKPRVLGTKALKAVARKAGLPVRVFARNLQAANDNDELAPIASKWFANKSRATGHPAKVCRVIPLTKPQLDSALAAVRKLWGPPPKRGVAVVKKKSA